MTDVRQDRTLGQGLQRESDAPSASGSWRKGMRMQNVWAPGGRASPGCGKLARGTSSMRSKRLSWLCHASLLALAALALPARAGAGDEPRKPGPRVVQEPDKVVVRKRTIIDFNDVTVEGELTRPEGSYLLNRNRSRFESVVKLREDFNPELQKSADNL